MSDPQDKTLKEKAEAIELKLQLIFGEKKRHLYLVPSEKDVEQFERLEGL